MRLKPPLTWKTDKKTVRAVVGESSIKKINIKVGGCGPARGDHRDITDTYRMQVALMTVAHKPGV